MKTVSGKALARILERNGWALMRIQGSHHIYGKRGCASRISVPIHENKPIKTGMLKYFLKQAKLSEKDL